MKPGRRRDLEGTSSLPQEVRSVSFTSLTSKIGLLGADRRSQISKTRRMQLLMFIVTSVKDLSQCFAAAIKGSRKRLRNASERGDAARNIRVRVTVMIDTESRAHGRDTPKMWKTPVPNLSTSLGDMAVS